MDKLDYYTEDPVGIWDKEDDCHSGDYMFHFWSTYKHHFRLEQTISKKKLKNDRKPAYQKICRLQTVDKVLGFLPRIFLY